MRSSGGHQVMIVDDDVDILDVARRVLAKRGYDVITAENGAEALHLLRKERLRPNLILLDLMMPVMDGSEFRYRQNRDPRLSDIPVVLFSGDDGLAAAASNLKSMDFVQKPISVEQLVAVAERYCG